MGSSVELKNWLGKSINDKLKKHYRGKDWEVVAFTSDWIVLRIDRENVKFNRNTAKIIERVKL